MLIKSLSIKSSPGIDKLLEYIFDPSKRYTDSLGREAVFFHNLKKDLTTNEISETLKSNVSNLSESKRRNKAYHFVLSASPEDSQKVDSAVLRKITRKFIGLLNIRGVYISCGHMARNPHVHIIASGQELARNKSIAVSKKEFSAIQQRMQTYVAREFGLTNSVLNYGHKERIRANEKFSQFERRTHSRNSFKLKFMEQLHELVSKVNSTESYFKLLEQHSIKTYMRNGKVVGLIHPGGRKYRFTTLQLHNLNHYYEDKRYHRRQYRDHESELMSELQQIRERNQQIDREQER